MINELLWKERDALLASLERTYQFADEEDHDEFEDFIAFEKNCKNGLIIS